MSLVLAEMARLELLDRANVQSFDSRIMEEVRRQAPGVRLAWLVGNEDGFDANMARLSFVPDIYSPHHGLVDSTLVEAVRARGMTLIPWTINDPIRMKELIDLGVDGIITDYPDRVPGSSE
ncbi:MAG: glycerophosphodiester phosphodiesterase family protein [Bacteroidetes bacterium]|nr:glycerophosphodiester phosphodiesterase family protein [Bacteroidota bacterium]